jgi:hypothetical protein
VIGTDLYRKAASTGILMKCILRSKGLQLLAEIHSGECGCHATSTNLVSKAYRSGFYWPTAATNTKDLVKRCKRCQFFAKQQHLPAQALPRYVESRRCGAISYHPRRLQTYTGCRMDLAGPTTSVGTRTDYSVGSWDYSACATRHLMVWGARTTVEKFSDRKLYLSCTM